MNFRIEFDANHGIVHLLYEGRLTETSFLAGLQAIDSFAKSHSIKAVVTDFSAIGSDHFELSTPFLRSFAQSHLSIAPGKPRVVVATQPALFGLARMYQTLRESVSSSTIPGVARSLTDALKWLGVETADFRPADIEDVPEPDGERP